MKWSTTEDADDLVRVDDVDAFISIVNSSRRYQYMPIIVCRLEDGRDFNLFAVPQDIVLTIRKLKGYKVDDERETIYDILLSSPRVLEELRNHLRRVIIDSINPFTYTYSATAEFRAGGTVIRRKMVPSHAILLALLLNKPIFVKKKLVDEQEKFNENNDVDLDEDEDYYGDEEE